MIINQTDILGSVVWLIVIFIFFSLYPRIMLSQLIYKLEQSAVKLEKMSKRGNAIVAKKVAKKHSKELMEKIEHFTDFFVVEPSGIDPYGLVQKLDQTIKQMENRFDDFTDEIAGKMDYHYKQELNYGLRAAIGLRQISKIVRHFVEMAKKYKNLQIAMIIQMQLPMIEKIAESELKGTEAFVNGWPIGDSIGPLVVASMIDSSKEIAEDVMMGETIIEERKCFVLKAKGPSPHLGRIDDAINKIMKKNKISRIVTIDAAQKLEGEPMGAVAEGVGFAMGGIAQRDLIENVLLPKKMPIDSVIVKVGMDDAIAPMRKKVYESVPKATELIKKAVKRSKKREKVIIIGVGNSCGIGNSKKELGDLKSLVEKFEKKIEEEKKNKKGRWV